MTNFKSLLTLLAILLILPAAQALAKGPKGPTLWDIVQASDAHDTLEAAINCTEISSLLESNGQRTLFAPTDDAFLCHNLTAANICDGDTDALTAILADHLTTGRRDQTEVVASGSIKMFSGNRQSVEVDLGVPEVLVGGAALDLTMLDIGDPDSGIFIANGLIHFVGEGVVGLGLGTCD